MEPAARRKILGLDRDTFFWVAAAVTLLAIGIALDAFIGF